MKQFNGNTSYLCMRRASLCVCVCVCVIVYGNYVSVRLLTPICDRCRSYCFVRFCARRRRDRRHIYKYFALCYIFIFFSKKKQNNLYDTCVPHSPENGEEKRRGREERRRKKEIDDDFNLHKKLIRERSVKV